MDWIHCNTCFLQPGSNSNPSQFFLTSCGHIYCEKCNSSASSSPCRICNAQYTTTLLSSQLREEVREFFIADPTILLNKFTKVFQFQAAHRERFIANLRRAQTKYEAAKREIQKNHEEMKQMRKKMHLLQQELAWYKMQRDRARARAAAQQHNIPNTSTANVSPFGPPAATQRSALQQMQNSGMGDSRLTMGFAGTNTSSSRDALSPFSMPSTPVHGNQSRYRTPRTFMSTPESAVSRPASSSFLSPVDSMTPGFSQTRRQENGQLSPPSRGTPTDALKLLTLAYNNPKNSRK